MKTKITSILFIALLFISINACSDNGSSPKDNGEPPSIPSFETAENIDISFFENNMASAKSSQSELSSRYNFAAAYLYAMSADATIMITNSYGAYFDAAKDFDADYKDGKWIWEYDYSGYGTINFKMVMTAQDLGESVRWDLTYSIDSDGIDINDYTFVSGTIAKDNSSATWTFYNYSQDDNPTIAIQSTYQINSETDKVASVIAYDNDGNANFQIRYTLNGNNNLLTFDYYGSDIYNEVFWNTSNKTGYIIDADGKQCWDQNFNDVVCD